MVKNDYDYQMKYRQNFVLLDLLLLRQTLKNVVNVYEVTC